MPSNVMRGPRNRGRSFASSRTVVCRKLIAALVSIAVCGPHLADATDYVWTNAGGTGNWFTGGNWSPGGPPPFGTPGTAFIDNVAGTASRVQIAPSFLVSTPNCSGLACGVSATANLLRIDAGDTVVIGGSAVYSDNAA